MQQYIIDCIHNDNVVYWWNVNNLIRHLSVFIEDTLNAFFIVVLIVTLNASASQYQLKLDYV